MWDKLALLRSVNPTTYPCVCPKIDNLDFISGCMSNVTSELVPFPLSVRLDRKQERLRYTGMLPQGVRRWLTSLDG